MASGEWFLPGGSSPVASDGESSSTAGFSRSRRPSAVLLNRRNNVIGPEGLYRCDVIDARNIIQALYIGINQSRFNMRSSKCNFNYFIHISDANYPRVPVMVNAVIITSSSATIQWSFPRLLEMRNEIISIFYGTISDQPAGVITYPIPSDPNMEQYSIQLMSLQPGTRYVYQIYSSNEFANRTDGVEYDFRTDDSSEFNILCNAISCMLISNDIPQNPVLSQVLLQTHQMVLL